MRRHTPWNQIHALGLLALLFVFAVLPARRVFAAPNVVIINIDDMGLNDLAPYNTDSVQADTPTATRLANQGLRFDQFHVNSPICSASRAGLLTGQYPSRWGINAFIDSRANNRARDSADYLSLQAPMMARTFSQAGYATANVGKWHLGGGRDIGYGQAPLITQYGFDQSLTQFEGLGDRVLYQNPNGVGLEALSQASKNLGTRNGQDTLYEIQRDMSSSFYVDRAIQFVQQSQQANKPFFMNLAFDDVHTPYDPKPDLLQKYQQRYPSLPASVQQYLAVMDNLDTQIGRFIDAIDASGLGNNTLILLTADNGAAGPPSNNGSVGALRGQKGSLYEGGLREPLIVRWTGRIAPGQVNAQTVMMATDMLPSLASVIGLPSSATAGSDGQDLSSALLGDSKQMRSGTIYFDYGRNSEAAGPALGNRDHSPNLALRDGDFKLLINGDGTTAELYNLANDPNESANLVAQSGQSARVYNMARQVLQMRYTMPSVIPPESSTRVVQLRAETLTGADGSVVSSFADSVTGDSFNGSVSQSTAGNQPTLRKAFLNGKSVLQFDGDDVLLSSQNNSLPSASRGLTIFLVATGDQTTNVAQRASQVGSSTGANGKVVGTDVSSETGFRFNNGNAVYNANLTKSDFHIMVFRVPNGRTYADATMFIDGTTSGKTFTGNSSNVSGIVDFSGTDLELILGNGRLNSSSLSAGDYFTGMLAEMQVYNEQMTELQINLVANYLSTEYGLPFSYDTSTAIPEPSAAAMFLVAIAFANRRPRR